VARHNPGVHRLWAGRELMFKRRLVLLRAAFSRIPPVCICIDDSRLRELINERLNQFASELAEAMAARKGN
jgi:hypothetical protein